MHEASFVGVCELRHYESFARTWQKDRRLVSVVINLVLVQILSASLDRKSTVHAVCIISFLSLRTVDVDVECEFLLVCPVFLSVAGHAVTIQQSCQALLEL